MTRAYVGLGANLGRPAAQIGAAAQALAALPHTALVALSPLYRSAAIGPAGQPDYCNAVAALDTALVPAALLAALQAIETAAGRVRGERWGARVLDLDLLLHGDSMCATPVLTLPHPEMTRRAFVLQPLCDLAADAVIPGVGSVGAALAALAAAPLERWS
jgi:2-amino-4-hydroxy-6-hydroxymethyldihydropteridine diphosphokinase